MRSSNLRRRAGGLLFLSIATACIGCAGAAPLEFVGTPSRVFDGDSFMLRVERREIEVRLVDIDAPEHGQPYADTARGALDGLIWKERLRVVVVDDDKYGRKVCRVYRLRDGLDVNRRLVADGHVWVYKRHVRDATLYDLESSAHRARRGLWALPQSDLEPPWRWRREHARESRTSKGPSPP